MKQSQSRHLGEITHVQYFSITSYTISMSFCDQVQSYEVDP